MRLLLFLLLSGQTLAAPPTGLLLEAPTAASPIELHSRLRQGLLSGHDNRPLVRLYEKRTGDRSFSELARFPAGSTQGLHLQRVGIQAWETADYPKARRLYQKAFQQLLTEGYAGEALFCLYYISQLYREEGHYWQTLALLDRALQLRQSLPRTYLDALLQESRGQALWQLNLLPESVEAFSKAIRHWNKLGYRTALVASWNNLAAIYEELQLDNQALRHYQRALQLLDSSVLPEVELRLLGNVARFQAKRGETSQAYLYLSRAQHLKHLEPERFQLWEAEVHDSLAAASGITNLVGELEVERLLLQGRLYLKRGQGRLAFGSLRKATRISDSLGLQRLHFLSRHWLGQALESLRRYSESAEVYESAFLAQPHLYRQESVLPYLRISSPLSRGWVRSLVWAGRPSEARQVIIRLTLLRQRKARLAQIQLPGRIVAADPTLDRFSRLPSLLENEAYVAEVFHQDLPTSASAEGYTTVEIWPEERELFLWVDHSAESNFLQLPLPKNFWKLLTETLTPYYTADKSLPYLDLAPLEKLYKILFAPLENQVTGKRLLLILHDRIAALPFELLVDSQGRFLGERLYLSYLPIKAEQERISDANSEILFLSEAISGPEKKDFEEGQLRLYYPNLETRTGLATSDEVRGRWVHFSMHLRLDHDLWPASQLNMGSPALTLSEFLARQFSCRLVSLAVCDWANAFELATPYWMGLSENLLARGVEALLVSRWELDEISSQIYLDFYRRCRLGMPMDESLTLARRAFMRRSLSRDGVSVSGRHPFFWAGIAYLGEPRRSLYPRSLDSPWLPTTLALGLLLFLFKDYSDW